MLFSDKKLKIRCGSFFITHHIFVFKVYIKKPQKQKNIVSIRDRKGTCQPRQKRVSTGRQKIYRFHKAWDVLYGTDKLFLLLRTFLSSKFTPTCFFTLSLKRKKGGEFFRLSLCLCGSFLYCLAHACYARISLCLVFNFPKMGKVRFKLTMAELAISQSHPLFYTAQSIGTLRF